MGGLCPGTGRLSPHDIGSVTRFSGHPVGDGGSGSVLGVFGRRTAGRSGKHGRARLAAVWVTLSASFAADDPQLAALDITVPVEVRSTLNAPDAPPQDPNLRLLAGSWCFIATAP